MDIFKISSLEGAGQISTEIKKAVVENGSALIRGLFSKAKILNTISLIEKELDTSEILGTTQGTRETVRNNTIKWSVGAATGAQSGNARLMVTVYNPIFKENCFEFRAEFLKLIQLRDLIRGDGYRSNDEHLKGDAFNACRFQIYPKGGGFMLGHRDYAGVETAKNQNSDIYNYFYF